MIEIWVLVVACAIHLYLGIFLGLRIARREREEREAWEPDQDEIRKIAEAYRNDVRELRKRGWL